MNGLDALLIALVIAFSFVCWLCFQDFDRWVHYEADQTGPGVLSDLSSEAWAEGLNPGLPGASTSRPFNWQEDAA